MIYRPLKPITKIKDAIFLAGSPPRVGIEYNDPCEWREEFIDILRGKGFTGDFIDPVNPNFNQSNLAKQIKWEWEGLKLYIQWKKDVNSGKFTARRYSRFN